MVGSDGDGMPAWIDCGCSSNRGSRPCRWWASIHLCLGAGWRRRLIDARSASSGVTPRLRALALRLTPWWRCLQCLPPSLCFASLRRCAPCFPSLVYDVYRIDWRGPCAWGLGAHQALGGARYGVHWPQHWRGWPAPWIGWSNRENGHLVRESIHRLCELAPRC